MNATHFTDLFGRPSVHAVNPYRPDFQADFGEQFKPKGGLTLEDIDRLVSQKLEDARAEFDREKQTACAEAWDEGRTAGQIEGGREAIADARRVINGVINGRLNHDVRRLRDRQDAPKTTIATERQVMRRVANDVDDAIDELQGIGGPG